MISDKEQDKLDSQVDSAWALYKEEGGTEKFWIDIPYSIQLFYMEKVSQLL